MEHHPTRKVKIERLPGCSENVCTLKVEGALTINNFFDFQDAARNSGARLLILDLADVPYIDSAALGCLIEDSRFTREDRPEVCARKRK